MTGNRLLEGVRWSSEADFGPCSGRVFRGWHSDLHPLAIGIRDQVLEAIASEPNAPDAGIVLRALGMWTKSGPYVTAAAKGRNRLNLDGTVATPISDAHRAYAQRVLDERKARRKPATASKPTPAPIARSGASTRPTLTRRRSA